MAKVPWILVDCHVDPGAWAESAAVVGFFWLFFFLCGSNISKNSDWVTV